MDVIEQTKKQHLKLRKKLLAEAELLFGPKLTELRFGNIVYKPGVPALDYEKYIGAFPPIDKVDIRLSPEVLTDETQVTFQLAHEVVHLLSPLKISDNPVTNNLEEGAAVYFSKIKTAEIDPKEAHFKASIHMTGYLYAYSLVDKLLKSDSSAITKLRLQQPHFTLIKPIDFKKAGLDVSDELISALLKDALDILPEDSNKLPQQDNTAGEVGEK